MSSIDKNFLYLSFFAALVSGLVYGWMIYFMVPANEWDIINHPFQKYFQASHIVLSPLLVFSLGLIWNGHVWKKIKIKETQKKTSGFMLVILLVPMIFSGYFIQVSQSSLVGNINKVIHIATSVIWSLALLFHLLKLKK